MAIFAALLEALCCLGLGAAAMRVLGIDGELKAPEHWALSFAAGFGLLGWLIFPIGISGFLSDAPLLILLVAGALGVILLKPSLKQITWPRLDFMGRVLIILLGIVFVFDVLEALAPPADADTLGYHFARPQEFLAAGRINFILQPLNGSIPFGIHMTYVPALALGGEMGLTFWTLISGWAAAALLYVLCRAHLGVNWSLTVALVFLTVPAVIYGGGSGQIETRAALFVMLTAWAMTRAFETGHAKYALLAGLGAGFFMAAKYTGLLFAAGSGLVLVCQRRWLVHGAAFGLALLAAGFQWYAWNAVHTGDPVFPMLFQWLGQDDLALWPKAHDLIFKQAYFGSEAPLARTPWSLVFYPFAATLGLVWLPDTGRVGFGPYGLLLLPFVALGVWQFRARIRRGPLLTYAILSLLFYVAWFVGGGSQRIRHLIPVLPLFLICFTVAAIRWSENKPCRAPLIGATVVTVLAQMAGQGAFGINYLQYLTNGETRKAFLMRNVNAFSPVPWINANLGKTDRVLHLERQLKYYLKVPSLFGSTMQAAIDARAEVTDGDTLYRQARAAGITHFLLLRQPEGSPEAYQKPMHLLYRMGCLERVRRFKTKRMKSRTLPALRQRTQTFDLLRLKYESCRK
ncbi:MAG: glycosyltransferase family 39 protein [Rhodospirillales bacterium]|nr:glycosyltransferase family 39 protein [Rhodospirillales bacterium]